MAGSGSTLEGPRRSGGVPVRWFCKLFSRSTILWGGYNLVRVFLGLLLLTAAGLKAHQLLSAPPTALGCLSRGGS